MKKIKIPITKFSCTKEDVRNIQVEDMSLNIIKCLVGSNGDIFIPALFGAIGSVIYQRKETLPKSQHEAFMKDMRKMFGDVLDTIEQGVG